MLWILVFTRRPTKVHVGEGYFNCPECHHREPCLHYQWLVRRYLYGLIPVSYGEPLGPEAYHCIGCLREYSSETGYPYDYGEHREPRTWKCFKCRKEIAYDRFDCPHCGYHLDVEKPWWK